MVFNLTQFMVDIIKDFAVINTGQTGINPVYFDWSKIQSI